MLDLRDYILLYFYPQTSPQTLDRSAMKRFELVSYQFSHLTLTPTQPYHASCAAYVSWP